MGPLRPERSCACNAGELRSARGHSGVLHALVDRSTPPPNIASFMAQRRPTRRGHLARALQPRSHLPEGGLVFGSTQWGVLLWHPGVFFKDGFHFVAPQPGKETEWTFVPIHDHSHWEAVPCRALAPAEVARRCPNTVLETRSILLVKEGRPESLLRAAARLGFKGMVSHHLEKMLLLHQVCDQRTARCMNEAAMVRRLVEYAFPGSEGAFIESCLACRGKAPAVESVLMTDGAVEQLVHSLDDDDHEELKSSVAKAKPKAKKCGAADVARTQAAAREAHTAASRSDPAPAQTGRQLRTLEFRDEWTLEAAKALCPPVPKLTLGKDTRRFFRWSGYYRKPTPPYHVTKLWGPCTGLSQQGALFFVVRQLWAWHKEQSGEDCAWALDGRGTP